MLCGRSEDHTRLAPLLCVLHHLKERFLEVRLIQGDQRRDVCACALWILKIPVPSLRLSHLLVVERENCDGRCTTHPARENSIARVHDNVEGVDRTKLLSCARDHDRTHPLKRNLERLWTGGFTSCRQRRTLLADLGVVEHRTSPCESPPRVEKLPKGVSPALDRVGNNVVLFRESCVLLLCKKHWKASHVMPLHREAHSAPAEE